MSTPILRPPQQVRQLGNVHRGAPRLVLGQPSHSHAPAGLVFVINVRERLALGVADAKALGGRVVDAPGRRECAVIGHSPLENEQGTIVNWVGVAVPVSRAIANHDPQRTPRQTTGPARLMAKKYPASGSSGAGREVLS
jgi:hypothetical protein